MIHFFCILHEHTKNEIARSVDNEMDINECIPVEIVSAVLGWVSTDAHYVPICAHVCKLWYHTVRRLCKCTLLQLNVLASRSGGRLNTCTALAQALGTPRRVRRECTAPPMHAMLEW